MCVKYYLLLLCLVFGGVAPARILGVFPLPSKSHQFVFGKLTQELAKRGHDLVVITPDPMGSKNIYNITEIDISVFYTKFLKFMQGFKPLRGAIVDMDTIIENDLYKNILAMLAEVMNEPQVRKFMNDKEQKFDLILAEAFFEYHLILSEIFKAPVIMVSSFMGFAEHYEMLGAFSRHPIYYPHLHRQKFTNFTIWEFLTEVYKEYRMYRHFQEVDEYQDELLKINFGKSAPTTKTLKENVDMLFLSVHPMFANNRPVPPNVIYFHAPHLHERQELPKDLKSYLDDSPEGVVYVSLGSNVQPTLMAEDLLGVFLRAFENLPYKFLWKFNGDDITGIPKNVKVQKWFPQQDVLNHPNIKVFVTQVGIQSASEAIDAAVPLVGVPMSAEQWYNAQKLEDFDIGVKLNSMTMTAEELSRAIKNVFEESRYKDNILRLRNIFRDQPESSLEKVVWWTEYVLRHGGAKHLKSPAANITLSEYYMTDLVLTILSTLIAVITVIILALYYLLKKILLKKKNETKKKKN